MAPVTSPASRAPKKWASSVARAVNSPRVARVTCPPETSIVT